MVGLDNGRDVGIACVPAGDQPDGFAQFLPLDPMQIGDDGARRAIDAGRAVHVDGAAAAQKFVQLGHARGQVVAERSGIEIAHGSAPHVDPQLAQDGLVIVDVQVSLQARPGFRCGHEIERHAVGFFVGESQQDAFPGREFLLH